jgi:hypothetical protein
LNRLCCVSADRVGNAHVVTAWRDSADGEASRGVGENEASGLVHSVQVIRPLRRSASEINKINDKKKREKMRSGALEFGLGHSW